MAPSNDHHKCFQVEHILSQMDLEITPEHIRQYRMFELTTDVLFIRKPDLIRFVHDHVPSHIDILLVFGGLDLLINITVGHGFCSVVEVPVGAAQ